MRLISQLPCLINQSLMIKMEVEGWRCVLRRRFQMYITIGHRRIVTWSSQCSFISAQRRLGHRRRRRPHYLHPLQGRLGLLPAHENPEQF